MSGPDGLRDRVLAALAAATAGPDGATLTVRIERVDPLREATATYWIAETRVATRRVRIDERMRVVSMLSLESHVWWFDGTSIHEQLLTHLAGAGCVVRAALAGSSSAGWAPYFEWAPGMGNLNAAAVRAAVEAVTPMPGETVWGGADLPGRVQSLAPCAPGGEDGVEPAQGGWRRLVDSVSPLDLMHRLDGLHEGLAAVVFAHLPTWYGERVVA